MFNLKSNFQSDLSKPYTGPKISANWMGWFKGSDPSSHHRINVCNSDNPDTVRAQTLAAHSVGIDRFVVDWYGGDSQASHDFASPTDKATQLLFREAAKVGMEVSIMIDSGTFKWAQQDHKQVLNAALAYIRQKYLTQPNYTRFSVPDPSGKNPAQTKPVVWEFSWANAGMDVSQFAAQNPDLCVLTQTTTKPGCAGSYGWVNGGWGPNNGLCAPDAPLRYMQYYLSRPDMIQVPCIFDGFDDTAPGSSPPHSVWDKNKPPRLMPYGQWQMCIDQINAAIQRGKHFQEVQICTWNDYDEGTERESLIMALNPSLKLA